MNKKFITNSNYVLRKVLNNEKYLDIIKDFIEAILNINIEEIELNSYLKNKEIFLPKEENFGIVDVRIKTDENEEINVGIQFIDGIYVQTKMLMYYAQIHLNQLKHDETREFVKTITINIIDFKYFSSKEYLKIIKIKSNEMYVKLEELEFYIIELPKFTYTKNMNKKDQWIAYLKGEDDDNISLEEIKKKNENIKLLDKMIEKYWLEEEME